MIDKKAIIKNFSRYPHLYDRFADIQRLAASKLAHELPKTSVDSILELGSGTGIYTTLLRRRFKESRILALDISQRMSDFARKKIQEEKIDFVTADAEDVGEGNFDIVTANAFFQWIGDADKTIKNYKKVLSENGILLFSAFGPGTYRELKNVVRTILGTKSNLGSDGFLTKNDWQGALKKYFCRVKIRETITRLVYPSLYDLLLVIKYTGVRGYPAAGFAWSKNMLGQAEKLYKKQFGRITATHQIFICKAM